MMKLVIFAALVCAVAAHGGYHRGGLAYDGIDNLGLAYTNYDGPLGYRYGGYGLGYGGYGLGYGGYGLGYGGYGLGYGGYGLGYGRYGLGYGRYGY